MRARACSVEGEAKTSRYRGGTPRSQQVPGERKCKARVEGTPLKVSPFLLGAKRWMAEWARGWERLMSGQGYRSGITGQRGSELWMSGGVKGCLSWGVLRGRLDEDTMAWPEITAHSLIWKSARFSKPLCGFNQVSETTAR